MISGLMVAGVGGRGVQFRRRVLQWLEKYLKEWRDELRRVFEALPADVETIFARADSGFYCWDAVAAYEAWGRPVHHLGPQDSAFGGGVENSALEAVSAHW